MKYLEIPKRKSHQNSSTAKILESTKVSQINDIEKERERERCYQRCHDLQLFDYTLKSNEKHV